MFQQLCDLTLMSQGGRRLLVNLDSTPLYVAPMTSQAQAKERASSTSNMTGSKIVVYRCSFDQPLTFTATADPLVDLEPTRQRLLQRYNASRAIRQLVSW